MAEVTGAIEVTIITEVVVAEEVDLEVTKHFTFIFILFFFWDIFCLAGIFL